MSTKHDPAGAASSATSEPPPLSPAGKAYLVAVCMGAAVAAAPVLTRLDEVGRGWAVFALFAITAAVAQVCVVDGPRNHGFSPAIVFMVAAVLVLPLELVLLLPLVQHVPEWLKYRYSWVLQSFNVSNHTLNLCLAWLAAHGVAAVWPGSERAGWAVGGFAACAVFVLSNHVVLAVMLRLGRGHGIRETGLFSFESLSTDLVLGTLGLGLAAAWLQNPWLTPVAVAPLVLIHRALSVPALQEEARLDSKTGLYNARHFGVVFRDELERARRFERPLSLLMADLDLLREVNNNYGHLAGDAVLERVAKLFRAELRNYDVAARFGGEEFSIVLPETELVDAIDVAERIRRTVAETEFEVPTSTEPIRVTVSIGVASFPEYAADANELIHQADLAVYRAKLQGRNRVHAADRAGVSLPPRQAATRLVAVPDESSQQPSPAARERDPGEAKRERRRARPQAAPGPRLFDVSGSLRSLVALVSVGGIAAGVAGAIVGPSVEVVGVVAMVALVAAGQALALEVEDQGSLSVSAVGALAGAALLGARGALVLAAAIGAVEWSARRWPVHQVLFNVGTLALAGLAAASVFSLAPDGHLPLAVAGVAAGAAYFAVNMGLLTAAIAVEGREPYLAVFRERFAWLLGHYLAYGFVAAAIAIAYESAGVYALAVFLVPLLLMRKSQQAYVVQTERTAHKLRKAAETIQTQNVSLEQANRLLRERSMAAMASLSATVDIRDSYTAGHSRRVQQIAVAVGRELGLCGAELEVLAHAALFHDIGKLAIPDAILLKPARLDEDEWAVMKQHAEEGARIIERLAFLDDAVPSIRHHHERWDGAGYPDRICGDDIPLGARIIHVADALDSMVTTRSYRAARPFTHALEELRRHAGTQFCPRCVSAVEAVVPMLQRELGESARLVAAS